jgi:glutathione peroxidase-family protein
MKSWPLFLTVPALVAVTAIPATARGAEDPDTVLWRIRAENAKRLQQREPDIAAIIKTRADTAKAAVKGVDPATFVSTKALAWAQLYYFAEEYEESRSAARRFLTSSPSPAAASMAQHIILDSSLRLGDAQALLATLNEIKPPSPAAAARIAVMTGTELAGAVAEKLGTQAGLDLLARVEALVPFDQLIVGTDKARADQARISLAMGRADLLSGAGRHAEALAALGATRQKMADGSPAARQIDRKLKQVALVGSVAPPLARERGYGDFAGLESLRGKVVLVDFTAHWSPFSKRGYPAMRKMYDELKSKGLEVVGVTTYYGFFGSERGITEDQEFAKLADYQTEYNINWPIVVGPRSNSEAYGVNNFPHYVVLGRDGKVVSYTAGYSTDLFHRLRASVEKALAQKQEQAAST